MTTEEKAAKWDELQAHMEQVGVQVDLHPCPRCDQGTTVAFVRGLYWAGKMVIGDQKERMGKYEIAMHRAIEQIRLEENWQTADPEEILRKALAWED